MGTNYFDEKWQRSFPREYSLTLITGKPLDDTLRAVRNALNFSVPAWDIQSETTNTISANRDGNQKASDSIWAAVDVLFSLFTGPSWGSAAGMAQRTKDHVHVSLVANISPRDDGLLQLKLDFVVKNLGMPIGGEYINGRHIPLYYVIDGFLNKVRSNLGFSD
jgi:hypothetical protein